jgi:hypothetical protein
MLKREKAFHISCSHEPLDWNTGYYSLVPIGEPRARDVLLVSARTVN